MTIGSYTQAITARLILTLVDGSPDYATVGVSSLTATIGSGAIGLDVGGGLGAFVIYDDGIAGQVTVQTASLSGAGVLALNAQNLQLRFNSRNLDVGHSTPVVVGIDDNSAHDVSLQFIGNYYHQYLAVSGTAELSGLAGLVTLGGNFSFERARIDTNNDSVLENVFKISATDLHFDLKAGSLTVVSFNHGSGAFIITSGGLAGTATLDFDSGVVGLSGTLMLEVNSTSTPIVNAMVPTSGGTVAINLPNTNYLRVVVTNAYIHLGSVAVPIPGGFQVVVTGGTVVIEPVGGGTDYVSVDASGHITTGFSFSDFAAPGPFEFVSMLRQALIWIDTFPQRRRVQR